ncbi:MAG: RNA polymerase sigma factor [Phycisphaerae bacterium]
MSDPAAQSRIDADEIGQQDAEQVARTLRGDTAAFDVLIERYQRRAVAVAYRLLGNIEDAKDVCQDAFIKGFKSLASLQQPDRFGAWQMRIVTNLSLNFRRGRRANLSLSTEGEQGGINLDQVTRKDRRVRQDPSEPLQIAEARQAVTNAIEALPEPQRLALVLFAIERIPQKEVAEIMKCSVEMVKWNVFQARKTLKKTLAELIRE